MQKRAIRTLWTVLDAIDQMWLPVVRTWRLNERHYGGLTGLNKAETAAKHGEAQVKIWRRSYDIPPPPMEPNHPFYSNISKVQTSRDLAPSTQDQGIGIWASLFRFYQCLPSPIAFIIYDKIVVISLLQGMALIC